MTTDYIGLQVAAIAAIAGDIVGSGDLVAGELRKAFSTAPSKLDTAELPALYALTGPAERIQESDEWGEQFTAVNRIYRIQVPVLPFGQASPELRETKCRALVTAVFDLYEGSPSLRNTESVIETEVLGDSGIAVLPEFGAKFVGFETRLRVKYVYDRVYQTGE